MGNDLVSAYRNACLVSGMLFVTFLLAATATDSYGHPVMWILGSVSVGATVVSGLGAIWAAHRENGKYLGRRHENQ